MCDKVIIENGGMLMFTSDCYKDNNCYCCLCNKAVDDYAHVLGSVPDCYKTQKICDKAANTCPFVFDSVPEQNCFWRSFFMLEYCCNKYKIQ